MLCGCIQRRGGACPCCVSHTGLQLLVHRGARPGSCESYRLPAATPVVCGGARRASCESYRLPAACAHMFVWRSKGCALFLALPCLMLAWLCVPCSLPVPLLCHACVQGNSSSGDVIITQLQWGPVQIYNTTLTCQAPAATGSDVTPPPVTLVAETAAQLLLGIQLLGQLQPSTITLARDMSVPADTWPKSLMVNRSLVLAGLPPPAPRTLLDMYQVGHGRAGTSSGYHHHHHHQKALRPACVPYVIIVGIF